MRIWLQKKRQELNLSQDDIAVAVGIKRPYYTMIENGSRNPSVKVAKKISLLLGCKWTLFFDDQCNEMKHNLLLNK